MSESPGSPDDGTGDREDRAIQALFGPIVDTIFRAFEKEQEGKKEDAKEIWRAIRKITGLTKELIVRLLKPIYGDEIPDIEDGDQSQDPYTQEG